MMGGLSINWDAMDPEPPEIAADEWTAFYWFRACPGMYYIYDRPRDTGRHRQQLGHVKRQPDGSYVIRDMRPGSAQPRIDQSRWTGLSAVAALQRHFVATNDLRAVDFSPCTFFRENF